MSVQNVLLYTVGLYGLFGHLSVSTYTIIEQVAFNKSRLLLKIILQNTSTLQLFTKKIKTEIIYKSN